MARLRQGLSQRTTPVIVLAIVVPPDAAVHAGPKNASVPNA
jgi:hypothetical protein